MRVLVTDGAEVDEDAALLFVAAAEILGERRREDVGVLFGSDMNEIKKIPEVVECLHITGAFDFQLKVYAKDIDHYHEFNFKKLTAIKNIRQMESYFVMKEVVNTTSLPILPKV